MMNELFRLFGFPRRLTCPVCGYRFKEDIEYGGSRCPRCRRAMFLNRGAVDYRYPVKERIKDWIIMPDCGLCGKPSVLFDTRRRIYLCSKCAYPFDYIGEWI